MTKLESKIVTDIFLDCLFEDNEDKNNYVKVEGIVHVFGFNPIKLELHKAEILELLLQLPSQFMESGGKGWSFLNACMDKNDVLWTGEHRVVEQLMCLGIAIEKVKIQLPKELWPALPGGVPYFMILDKD